MRIHSGVLESIMSEPKLKSNTRVQPVDLFKNHESQNFRNF